MQNNHKGAQNYDKQNDKKYLKQTERQLELNFPNDVS